MTPVFEQKFLEKLLRKNILYKQQGTIEILLEILLFSVTKTTSNQLRKYFHATFYVEM